MPINIVPLDSNNIYLEALTKEERQVGSSYAHFDPKTQAAVLERIEVEKNDEIKGKDMLTTIIEWATSKGARELTGTFAPDVGREDKAREFYLRNGFTIEGNTIRKALTGTRQKE